MRVPLLTAVRDSIRYGFATGKVRVLETRALGRSTFERLLDAPSFAEQRRILSETVYGRYLESVETTEGVEHALDEALEDFYGFLDESELPAPVVRYFRVRHDFANLKAALKARELDVPASGMLSDLGTVPAEAFAASLSDLPSELSSVVDQLEEAGELPGHERISLIDDLVDRGLYAELAECARRSRSEFLEGLAELTIDIANAKVLMRGRLAGRQASELAAALFDGGSVKRSRLAKMAHAQAAELAALLADLPGLRAVAATELADPARLDVVADNVVARYLRVARGVPVGAEPVIAYVLAREAEVVALRVVLIGTLSGLDSESLRVRLREQYG